MDEETEAPLEDLEVLDEADQDEVALGDARMSGCSSNEETTYVTAKCVRR